MSDIKQITYLAEETLEGQRVIRLGDSCLVGNGAAEDLKSLGSVVLPVIQQVVISRVVPASLEVSDHHELMCRFPGLSSLWVAYLRVAQTAHLQEAIAFLKTLEGSVLASAILACMSVWGKFSSCKLPPNVVTFLQEVARRPSDLAAEVAKHCLSLNEIELLDDSNELDLAISPVVFLK